MGLRTDDLMVELVNPEIDGPPLVEGWVQDWAIASGDLVVEVFEGVRGPQGAQGVPGFLPPVQLADAPIIAVNAALGSLMRVTLGGNRTLGNPTGGADSQTIMVEIKQDGVGGRTLAFQSKYNFGTDLTVINLSTGPGVTDRLLIQYVVARDEWDIIGFKKGF